MQKSIWELVESVQEKKKNNKKLRIKAPKTFKMYNPADNLFFQCRDIPQTAQICQ